MRRSTPAPPPAPALACSVVAYIRSRVLRAPSGREVAKAVGVSHERGRRVLLRLEVLGAVRRVAAGWTV